MAKRKIDEQISYNWTFFLLAGGFAAVTFWAVYDETITRREYKSYQEDFFRADTSLAREKVDAEEQRLAADAHYKELRARKDRLEGEIKARRGEIERAKAKLQEATFVAFDARQDYTFRKSEEDEAYYYLGKARNAALADPKDQGKQAEYAAREKVYRKLAKDTDDADRKAIAEEDKQKAAQAELDLLVHAAELGKLKKELEALERPRSEARRAWDKARKKTGGIMGAATEIVQQNLEDIGKVDRCESCHMGAARGGYEQMARREFRSHPMRRTLLGLHPPERFGCTSCHDGQGRATTRFHAHAPGPDEDEHAFHKHYWEYPLLKGPFNAPKDGPDGRAYMESKCRSCHKSEWDLRSELACESDIECPAAEGGRPMICDVPASPATKGMPHASVAGAERAAAFAAAVAAGTAKAEEPKKLCLALDPKAKLPEPDPAKTAEQRQKERKKLVDRARVANVQLAPHLARGLKIIEELGCYGCHAIEGYLDKPKPAPDLTRVAAKADAAWMVAWIMDPKAFRPNSRMPRFWPEMRAPDLYSKILDVDVVARQRQDEATAMAAFLLAQSKQSTRYPYELEPLPNIDDAAAGYKRGEELVATLGCAACHNIPGKDGKVEHRNRSTHFDHGPDLANVGAKTSKLWIYNWVKAPKRYAPATRMPDLRLSDQEAADIAEYLAGQTGGYQTPALAASLDDPKLIDAGRALVKNYGCYGCHLVEGFEDTPGIGAELTEFGVKTSDRLDFGTFIPDHNQQTWDKWTYHKLKHPRVYGYDLKPYVPGAVRGGKAVLRMPEFDLADDEVWAIMTVLKGMRGEDARETTVLAKNLAPHEQQREKGREIVRTYNCFGCHRVDGWDGDMAQLFPLGSDRAAYGPPILTGQGAKTQPEWLFGFLKEPFLLRPLPKLRMPTFGFTDEQATSLVAMFSALDGSPYPFAYYRGVRPADGKDARVGELLFSYGECQKCHIVGAAGGAISPDIVAPNLVMAKERLRPAWVNQWLADPNSLQVGTKMPPFWSQNLLDLAMKSRPEAAAALGDVGAYMGAKERQIEAVRNFLWVLEPPATPAAAATKPATPP